MKTLSLIFMIIMITLSLSKNLMKTKEEDCFIEGSILEFNEDWTVYKVASNRPDYDYYRIQIKGDECQVLKEKREVYDEYGYESSQRIT